MYGGKFAPQGDYIRRGNLTEGFFRYDFGGAYIWTGLFSEFYGTFRKSFYYF